MKKNISARGILEENGRFLFIEYPGKNSNYFALPGGSQMMGESLAEAVKREFKEETALDIEVGEIVLVREFILEKSHEEGWQQGIQQLEIIFRCTKLNPAQQVGEATVPDSTMIGTRWIATADFNKHTIFPTPHLPEIIKGSKPHYLFTRE